MAMLLHDSAECSLVFYVAVALRRRYVDGDVDASVVWRCVLASLVHHGTNFDIHTLKKEGKTSPMGNSKGNTITCVF